MLNDEICKLREKLNNSIISGQDYSITYQLSVELDDLIAQYYKEFQEKRAPKKEKAGKNARTKTFSSI